MTLPDIYQALGEIFLTVFGRRDLVVHPQLSAQDVADWDSFKQVEIILAVEERFSILLGNRDVDHLETVGDLAAVIATKLDTAEG